MIKVRQAMVHKPIVISSSANLVEAAVMMRIHDVGSLLVTDKKTSDVIKGGDLLGIVTDRDIVVRAIAEARDPEIVTVSQAFTTPIFTCLESDELENAVRIMEERRVRRLAVLSPESNDLTGLLSLDDIAERARKDLAGEALSKIVNKKSAQGNIQLVLFPELMKFAPEWIVLDTARLSFTSK